jgi:HlyD family secretion protein
MKYYTVLLFIALSLMFCACGKKYEKTNPIKKDVTEMVFASGFLEANNTYNLNAQTDGFLIQVNFNEGDIIRTGDLLAKIDNRESVFNQKSAKELYHIAESNLKNTAPAISQAKNTLELTRKKMELDSAEYVRYKELYDKKSVSKTEYENKYLNFISAESNYWSALENYKLVKQQAEQYYISSKTSKEINTVAFANNNIVSVVGGKVYKKFKQPGDYVRRGDVIATIGDPDFIYAKVSIDESNISKIKIGQEAVVQLNTNNQKTYKGRVAEIYPSFDESSQSFLCKIIFVDALDFNIVGTQLQVNIIIGKQLGALLIPKNYLAFDGTVMVEGKKEKTMVTTNFIGNEWVHITYGIDEKTQLIAEQKKSNKNDNSESLNLAR